MQEKACADLARLFAAEIAKAGLAAAAIETYATPRRLALIARGLPLATEAVSRGDQGAARRCAAAGARRLPRQDRADARAARRADRRQGQCVLFAVIEKPGRATAEVLAEAIPAVIRAFPWPKSMRWGAASASTRVAALGAAVAGHRRAARRRSGAVRGRRDRQRHRHARPPLPPSGADHDRQCRRLCRQAARLPCHPRSGRAARDHRRGRGEGGRGAGPDAWCPTRGWSPRMPG